MALSADKILRKTDLPRRLVRVPEWADEAGDDEVYIRTLTGAERDAHEIWRSKFLEEADGETPLAVRARLVVLACCDERGEPLFRPDQAEQLGGLSGVALDRVYDAVLVLNCMDRESQEAVRKNSKAPPADAGSSARPAA